MKAYTDIEQSKKLADILPIESADGYWFKGFPPQPYMVYTKGTPNPGEHIPCWSLAALLNIIHYPTLTQEENKQWVACSYPLNHLGYSSKFYNNPIDACYEMILSLHEQKIL